MNQTKQRQRRNEAKRQKELNKLIRQQSRDMKTDYFNLKSYLVK